MTIVMSVSRGSKLDHSVVLCYALTWRSSASHMLWLFGLSAADQATLCYEHACAVMPNNVEMLMALFKCYVREYVFVKQQQVCHGPAFQDSCKILNLRRFLIMFLGPLWIGHTRLE